ncbi:IS110 family transposase, partial [Rhodanobacter spathiphylli]|uniref:IS110 family transposase n=1 Tax=Rhodanobacter spathiphylli TaxID=347483 RepID=UPI001389A227
MVPTQHSSGGHARLGGISCRGDACVRCCPGGAQQPATGQGGRHRKGHARTT